MQVQNISQANNRQKVGFSSIRVPYHCDKMVKQKNQLMQDLTEYVITTSEKHPNIISIPKCLELLDKITLSRRSNIWIYPKEATILSQLSSNSKAYHSYLNTLIDDATVFSADYLKRKYSGQAKEVLYA